MYKKHIRILAAAAVLVCLLLALPVLALTEGKVEAVVAAQGKEKVSGNILVWFLCAIAFLKVSQKIDSFMSSLGINVGHTGGDMLGELMVGLRGVRALSGGKSGRGSGGSSGSSSTSDGTAFLSGGLAGAVSRSFTRSAASNVTNATGNTVGNFFSRRAYETSVSRGGDFANNIIGSVAKGNAGQDGTSTGGRAGEAMASYFGQIGKPDVLSYQNVEIGGGRIMGKESVAGAAPTEFAMFHADQYLPPEGPYTEVTAADGSKWYKQTPQDTVVKTPYLDASGNIQYHETLEQRMPQIPRRKDRV